MLAAASSVTSSKVLLACMSTWKNIPLAIALPVLQRVPALPSSALAGTSPPPLDEAVATQPALDSAVSPFVPNAVSFLPLSPMYTTPLAMVGVCQ